MYRLFGTRTQSSFSNWIVTHINFTSVFIRTCESSDYENWTVSDGVNNLWSIILKVTLFCDSVLGISSACWVRLRLLSVAGLVYVVGIVDNMNE